MPYVNLLPSSVNLSIINKFLLTIAIIHGILKAEIKNWEVQTMPKISKNLSISLSLGLAVFFLMCCVAGLFILPGLTQMLIDTPDNLGNRSQITPPERALVLAIAYCIVADFIFADCLLLRLLFRVKKGLVFTEATVSLIRGISWCCILLCVLFGILGIYFQLSFIVALLGVFLGVCLRVCKNAFEEAIAIKSENDLTV